MQEPITSILLVDDDDAKRYTIAKTLVRAGFEVQEAATGSEALRLVASLPDLVILDVKLPDIDGFEVCRRIKSDPATCAIPVLHISTTFVDIEDKVHGLDSGADGYLTNVAEPLELIATVRALLRARRAEDAAQLSTRQWQTTFDAISDGVMLLDASGKVVQANRTLERILGRPWTEIVGKELPDLWDGPTQPEESLFAQNARVSARARPTIARSGDCWLHVSVDPLRDGGRLDQGGTLPGLRHHRPEANGDAALARRPRNCRRPVSERTSSWPCWPTSCATRWRRSRIPCRSSACRSREMRWSKSRSMSRDARSST